MHIFSRITNEIVYRYFFPNALYNLYVISNTYGISGCRRHSRTRRRVYHTLDLDMADDEDDAEEDAAEDDWLVKRAKKEGITL